MKRTLSFALLAIVVIGWLVILGNLAAYAQPLDHMIARSAARNHVPVALVHRIIKVESGYRCNASSGIAFGIMQVQRATARSVGVHGNLMHCETGLEAGTRYLRQALDAARGNWTYAATLYNRGIAARPTRSHYASLVMGR